MNLTAENVESVFMDCLFQDGEDTSDPAIGEAVMHKMGFHRGRLASHKIDIAEMLAELPDEFLSTKGGGMSFLNACVTRQGEQWGEHRNIDQLLALGIASNQAKILFPRDMWEILPGGMPYFAVLHAP